MQVYYSSLSDLGIFGIVTLKTVKVLAEKKTGTFKSNKRCLPVLN